MRNPSRWAPGHEMLPDYVVEHELGRGGMGNVLLVQNRLSGKRYAVKTAMFSDAKARRRFMAELQRWHDLPQDDTHLVRCFFSREIEDRVHIFAEYVSGGSLDLWIRKKWLTGIKDMLDVAIQLARALQVLHDQSLVHQDVKPQNVLIGEDGTVKLADFGLAGARPRGGNGKDALVTVDGMTPAYRSPEQAVAERVDARTDQWSFALTVLTMFTGEATWRVGEAGPDALKDYCDNPGDHKHERARMPPRLKQVLSRALSDAPERWPSMAAVAVELENVYRSTTRDEYKPNLADARARRQKDVGAAPGAAWQSSRVSGDLSQFETRLDASSTHLQSSALATEVAAQYEELSAGAVEPGAHGQSLAAKATKELQDHTERIRHLKSRLDQSNGHSTVRDELISEYQKKAALHHRLSDSRAAIESFQQAASLIGGASHRVDQLERQASIHRFCGLLRAELREYDAALASLSEASRAVTIFRASFALAPDERLRLEILAARVAATEGHVLHKAGKAAEALDAFNRVMPLGIEVAISRAPELREELAHVQTRRGTILLGMGRKTDALAAFRDAAALVEGAPTSRTPGLEELLANALMWQGVTQHDLQARGRAEQLLQQSIEIREARVLPHDRTLGRIGLGQSYGHMGMVVDALRGAKDALVWYERSVKTWDALLHEHGLNEHADRLAISILRKSDAARRSGSPQDDEVAVAQRLVEYLVHNKDRRDLEPLLEAVKARAPLGEAEARLPEQRATPAARAEDPGALDPNSPEDEVEVGLSSDRSPALYDEPQRLLEDLKFNPLPPLPGFFDAAEDWSESGDDEEGVFSALDDAFSARFPQRRSWVPPRRIAVSQPRPLSDASLPPPGELLKGRQKPPLGCVLRRPRILPALLAGIIAAGAIGIMRVAFSHFAITANASLIAMTIVLFYTFLILRDGRARRNSGAPAYALTAEYITWAVSESRSPGWISLRIVRRLELTSDQDIILEVEADSRELLELRITGLGGGSLREVLLRPSSAASLFDALRTRIQNIGGLRTQIVDARRRT